MENSRVQYGSGRKRVSLGNIIGDPFALATISIAAVSRNFPVLVERERLHHGTRVPEAQNVATEDGDPAGQYADSLLS
jgi:hypothetical protein